MESQYQKWVNLSYLVVAAIAGYCVFTFGLKFSGIYDLEARIRNIELLIRGASVLVGAILFFVLFRNDKANQFMNEVVVELSRVTWPTQNDTSRATLVVIIMVVISGLVLGLFDYVWTSLLKFIV